MQAELPQSWEIYTMIPYIKQNMVFSPAKMLKWNLWKMKLCMNHC